MNATASLVQALDDMIYLQHGYVKSSTVNICYITRFQVQDSYYGQQEARVGHFPSSVVEETHALTPASTEVQTTVGERTHIHIHTHMHHAIISPHFIPLFYL